MSNLALIQPQRQDFRTAQISAWMDALHLTARNSVDHEVPKPNWIRLGIAVGLGVLIGIGFTANTPDMHSLALALKPWFADDPNQPD